MEASAVEADGPPVDDDLDLALALVLELERTGRFAEARAVYKLARAHVLRDDEAVADDDLPSDLAAQLDKADEAILAGKVIPHEVVLRGRAAADEFIRRRDAGQLDPTTAAELTAAVETFRAGWEARRGTRADA